MTGVEVVDVEVRLSAGGDPRLLLVFLHHPNPDGRVEAEHTAFLHGADYTFYPGGPLPRLASNGVVEVKDTNLYVSIGAMYVIAPLTIKSEEIAGIGEAIVYFTDSPFDPADQNEKTWLAARLPLASTGGS